jgi:hypothetical protein
MESQTVWEGTATQLLTAIAPYLEGVPKRQCPYSGQTLSGELRRLEPNLLRAGLTLTFDRQDGGIRKRMITIRKGLGDEPLPSESPTDQDG